MHIGASASLGFALRSAITGLPLSFLARGEVGAEHVGAKVMILACSGDGEPLNVSGPGTFEAGGEAIFAHPDLHEVDAREIGSVKIQGATLTAEDVATSAEVALGAQQARMARCFGALPAAMREHMVWFQHRTRAHIHPQLKAVLTAYGSVRGVDGHGAEELPSAIAQETAPFLETALHDPLVLSDARLSSGGTALPTHTPQEVRVLADKARDAVGGEEDFGALYDRMIDATYRCVRQNGTTAQRRFLDRHASSRRRAVAFGAQLGQLLEEITDDSAISQLKAAVVVAKLKLAPVVVIRHRCGGDNHADAALTHEAAQTLTMVQALAAYWEAARDLDALDEVAYASLDVFGRTTQRNTTGGRDHAGDFASALLVGAHLRGGVVGGIAVEDGVAKASGINTLTGASAHPDVMPNATLNAYFKTLMAAAGVPVARRAARLPDARQVMSVFPDA